MALVPRATVVVVPDSKCEVPMGSALACACDGSGAPGRRARRRFAQPARRDRPRRPCRVHAVAQQLLAHLVGALQACGLLVAVVLRREPLDDHLVRRRAQPRRHPRDAVARTCGRASDLGRSRGRRGTASAPEPLPTP